MTFALNVLQGNIWNLEREHKIHNNFKFVLATQKKQNDKNKIEVV